MNLRSNKGFTGTDILISLVVFIIFVPTIFGIIYNVNKTNREVTRESRAVAVATKILENAKSINVQNINLNDDGELETELANENFQRLESVENTDTQAIYSYEGTEGEHYRVILNLSYPNEEENDLVKLIKIQVEYPIGTQTKSIDISTVLKSN